MKRPALILLTLMMVLAVSCSGASPDGSAGEGGAQQTPDQQIGQTGEDAGEEKAMSEMILKINDEELSVKWEDNESVRALAELAGESPLQIQTSLYGGFEQVGGLGTTLPSSDTQQTAQPGDIMLYTGSNIVVFFGSNSWAYTKLGHIEGKSADELGDLLGNDTAAITITLK